VDWIQLAQGSGFVGCDYQLWKYDRALWSYFQNSTRNGTIITQLLRKMAGAVCVSTYRACRGHQEAADS
jgi:hypothetical protein